MPGAVTSCAVSHSLVTWRRNRRRGKDVEDEGTKWLFLRKSMDVNVDSCDSKHTRNIPF